MAQGAAEGVNLRRVLGAVHQVVKRGDALRGQLRQRNGGLRIMHAGTGQHGADREIATAKAQMKVGLPGNSPALSQPQS